MQKKTKQKAFNRPKHAKKHLQQHQNKTKKDKKKRRENLECGEMSIDQKRLTIVTTTTTIRMNLFIHIMVRVKEVD